MLKQIDQLLARYGTKARFALGFPVSFAVMLILIMPIISWNSDKARLHETKKSDVEYFKRRLNSVPKIINLSRGHILKDEALVKIMLKINVIARERVSDSNKVFRNQHMLVGLTDELVQRTENMPILLANREFQKTVAEYKVVSTDFAKAWENCRRLSKRLERTSRNFFYRFFVDLGSTADWLCK